LASKGRRAPASKSTAQKVSGSKKSASKKEAEAAARRRREAERRREEQQRKRTTLIGFCIGAALVALLVGIAVVPDLLSSSKPSRPTAPLVGLMTYDVPSRNHTTDAVTYAQSPPVGGDHNPVWQNCGFYSAQIVNEHGVHSLEHGAIWITYRPDLPQAQIDVLKKIAKEPKILVSPWPGLQAPVVASAWGKQILLDSATDPRLRSFIDRFRESPDLPEALSPCVGGTSATAGG
jgi:hypothetical protein